MGLIIAGWGKSGREIGFAGIIKCPNCKNHSEFALYESASKVTLYFIPIAKFNKKHYLVCSTCTASYELTNDTKTAIIAESAKLPSRDVYYEIWNKADHSLATKLESKVELGKALMDIKSELESEFGDEQSRIVLKAYWDFISDDDKPK